MSITVATSQPYFAPYAGFFHKAGWADVFVLLDAVQFPHATTWISRNRFKNEQGALWMTVPVWKKGLGLQNIDAVRICREGNWARKHLRSFKTAYAHAPFLSEHLPFLEALLSRVPDRLLDLNLAIIRYMAAYLQLKTKIIRLSSLGVKGRGLQLIIDICRHVGADRLMVQRSALKYHDRAAYAAAGIGLKVLRTPTVIYPQLWGEFIANLSVLDLMLNCGPKAGQIIFGSGIS